MTAGRKATTSAKPHPYDPDPDTPGTCRCHLIKANAAHDEQALAQVHDQAHAAQEEERRRLGERED